MSTVLDVLTDIDDMLWTIPFLLIVAMGVYCTFKFRFIQFTQIKEAIRVTFFREKIGEKNAYSSLHVFFVSMGNRIGVGNITGPILAILVGGPGAIFWMWVFALIGAATSFLETTVGQIYKEHNDEGGFFGGPAYNILHGLCNPKLAATMAAVMIMMHFIGFASMESCSISGAFTNALDFQGNGIVIALLLSGLLAIVMAGGFKRISRISVWFVPLMAIAWLILCCISIGLSKGGVLNAFGMIFNYAFNVPAAVGGGIATMLIIGMRRGILSNEAGIGTSTYISSMADVNHPCVQGYSQSLGVVIDIIVSTFTALVILSYGSYEEILATGLESQALLQYVFSTTIGSIAPIMVMVFVFVFAFSSLMGDFVIGASNVKYLTKENKPFVIACVVMLATVFLTAFYASDELYTIVDIFLGITATINCITMFMLSGRAVCAYRDYRRQKKEGIKDPVFTKDCMDKPEGITSWS